MSPRTRQAHIQVEAAGSPTSELGRVRDPELGAGTGVRARGVRRGELGHHKAPRGAPCRSDSRDEEARREGGAPEQFGEGIHGGGDREGGCGKGVGVLAVEAQSGSEAGRSGRWAVRSVNDGVTVAEEGGGGAKGASAECHGCRRCFSAPRCKRPW